MTAARDAAAAACIAGAGVGVVLITGAGMHPALAAFAALTVAGLLGSVLTVDRLAIGDQPTALLPEVDDDLMAFADACRETGSHGLAQLEAEFADIAPRFRRLSRNDRRAGTR